MASAFAAWPITAIKVHSSFEWLVQFDLNRETQTKKEAILQDLIKNLPQLQDNVEKDGLTYFMYPRDKCVMCDHPSLFISRLECKPHSISFTEGMAPWLELIM